MMETEDAVLAYQITTTELQPGTDDQLLRSRATFSNELAELWQSQRYMDVNLICAGNHVVKVHKLVLAALSSVFRRIFLEIGPLTETDFYISLAEVDGQVLTQCLQKVYLGDRDLASIEQDLQHLDFSAVPLEKPCRANVLQDAVQTTIKAEPSSFGDIAEFLGDESSLSIIPVKKNNVWKNFAAKGKDAAQCRLCSATIRTKGGCTSLLARHLEKEHPVVDSVVDAKVEPMDFDDFDEPSFDEVVAKGTSKKSKVWNFFVREEKDRAKCTACDTTIKTQNGNTSGMSRHLFRAHMDLYSRLEALREKDVDQPADSDEQPDAGADDDDDDEFTPFKSLRPRKKKTTKKRKAKAKNKVWEFFEQTNDGSEARCNTCLLVIKTDMGNTSGPVSHLKSSHPELYEELEDADDKALAVGGAVRNSPVWQFYEELGSNRVKCLKCNVVLKYYYGTTSGLLRHLKRSHYESYETIKSDDSVGPQSSALTEAAAAANEVDNETIWKFFHRNSEDVEKANCVECMLEVANEHGSLVTSCEEHLRGSHTEILEQYETQRKAFVHQLIKSDKTVVKRRYTSRVTASAIWSYFRKTADPAANQCSTCLLDIDCSQNTTAMVKHLEESHPEQHDAFKKQSGIEAKDIKKPSAIWKHFQPTEDPKKHRCIACSKEILCHYQTTSNLIRHLEHNHADMYETFLRESHGLEQSEEVNPLLKKPKKRNLNMKGSNDPVDRTCPDCGKEYSCRPAMLFHYKVSYKYTIIRSTQACQVLMPKFPADKKEGATACLDFSKRALNSNPIFFGSVFIQASDPTSARNAA